MPFRLAIPAFHVPEPWETFKLHQTPRGSVSYGMSLQGPEAGQTGEGSSFSCVASLITSTGLPKPSTFTIELRSITFEPWRGTGSYPRPVKNTASSTFSPQRWKPTSTSSTKYGVKYNQRPGR